MGRTLRHLQPEVQGFLAQPMEVTLSAPIRLTYHPTGRLNPRGGQEAPRPYLQGQHFLGRPTQPQRRHLALPLRLQLTHQVANAVPGSELK